VANCGQRSRMAGGNMSIDIDELWTTAAVRFNTILECIHQGTYY
jgi:hypothetical protein